MIIHGFNVRSRPGLGLSYKAIPDYHDQTPIRVVAGPETDRFTDEGIKTFYNEPHTISPESDRMGYRLERAEIPHKNGADIWSDAVPLGTIQVPANGQPIILMADRQTTGGYNRIATVISVDIPKIAQLPPGSKIRFHPVKVHEAQKLAKKREIFPGAGIWCEGFVCCNLMMVPDILGRILDYRGCSKSPVKMTHRIFSLACFSAPWKRKPLFLRAMRIQ